MMGDLIAPLPPGEDTARRRHLNREEGSESADALISDFGLQNWEKRMSVVYKPPVCGFFYSSPNGIRHSLLSKRPSMHCFIKSEEILSHVGIAFEF